MTMTNETTNGGLWRYSDGAREGKYLVLRRDGTVPEWPYFVLGARDPAAVEALYAYARRCRQIDQDRRYFGQPALYGEPYIVDIAGLARDFAAYFHGHGHGDPSAPKHRHDDPEVIAKMREARERGGGSA